MKAEELNRNDLALYIQRVTRSGSELPMSILDSCRLLVINLLSCVQRAFRDSSSFSWVKLKEYAYYAQRLMDDLIDLEIECVNRIIEKIEDDPQPWETKQREHNIWKVVRQRAEEGRRTGLGITALGDTLAGLSIPYGSDQSIEFTERVYQTIKLSAYECSVDMAEEIGPFPIWDKNKEKNNPFLLRIKEESPELYRRMQKHGRRNIALLTTAPTGSVSLLSKCFDYFGTTSGIEPLFKDEPYIRRKKLNSTGEEARIDFVDAKGDCWTEYEVYHSGIKMWMDVTGEKDWKKSPYHKCCAEDLDWKQRVKLQAAAQRHIDHAISSTINLPQDVTVEKVAEIYETAWKSKCKGITVYRKGCRDGVLVDKKSTAILKTTAVKRPKALSCDIHQTTIKGKNCVVFIGLYEGEPYEVFAVVNDDFKIPDLPSGWIVKHKRGDYRYVYDDESVESLTINDNLTDEQAAITRLTSTALRHGVDIHFVVHQLEKVRGDLYGFSKALVRVLKKYIKDGTRVSGEICAKCESDSLTRQEGCVTCLNCGNSKCS